MTSVHVVCPHCDRTNRVPAQRLGERPKCGACHGALFAGEPLELTAGNFARHVGDSELPVLVDFWAPWCGPCRVMAPVLAQAAVTLEPRLRIAKLDTEQYPDLAARYGIRGIPTLVLFKRGVEVVRTSEQTRLTLKIEAQDNRPPGRCVVRRRGQAYGFFGSVLPLSSP